MRCTACAPCCPVRLTLPPLAGLFPTALTLWMSTWCKWLAGPPAWALKRAWQESPGPAQGGRARPGPTPTFRDLWPVCSQDMASWWGVSSLVSTGPPNYGRCEIVRRSRCRWRVCRRDFVGGSPQHVLNMVSEWTMMVGCISDVPLPHCRCEPLVSRTAAAAAFSRGSTGWCLSLPV